MPAASFNVASVSPGFNATSVYLDSYIEVTFTDNVLAETVNEFTFNMIVSETSVAVEGTVTVVENNKIRFTPSSDLLGNTRYTVVVMGNDWGVLSAGSTPLPETVSWNFTTGLYTSANDASDNIPSGVDPEVQPSTDEIYIVSSTPDNMAVNVLRDSVVIVFDDLIPSGTYVDIHATHPLGYPAGTNYWSDNHKVIVSGKELTIVSSGDLSTSLSGYVAFVDSDPNLINPDSILISESGAAEGTTRHVRFGIDQNFLYTVKVKVPTNEFVPQIDFVSKFVPQIITVEELRLFSGGILNRFNDFTLATLLYRISLTAKGIWESHGFTWPTPPPYYAEQYVLYRSLRDMMAIVLRDSATAGGATQKLGELTLSAKPDSNALKDDLRNLDLMVSILAEKLAQGNTSNKPILGPAWSEAGKAGGVAVLGSNALDSSGRVDPMYRSNWSRGIKERTK